MPAARYWRIVGVETYAGGDLELSELHLYDASGRVDAAATLTSTIAPAAGTLAALQDDNLATICRFVGASVHSSGFALVWDFGASGAADVIGVRPASVGQSTFIAACDLQYSNDGAKWELLSRFARYGYPGDSPYALSPSISDPVFSSVALLLQFDGANGSTNIIDSGPQARVVTVAGTAQITTAQSKWGGGSLLLSGLDSDVSIPTPLSANSPFCMEAWAWLNATDAGGQYYHPIFAQGGNSGDSDQIFGIAYADRPNPLRLQFYRGSAFGERIELVGPEVISRQQWAHCALDYDGVTIRGYLNGVLQFSQVSASGWIATPQPFRVGRGVVVNYEQYRQGFQGCIGEVRVTLSSRYAASFTPPIQRFPTSQIEGTVYVPPPVRANAPSVAGVAAAALVPTHSTRRAPALQVARDVEFGGSGRIWGTTKIKGAAGTPDAPAKSRVVLLHQRSKLPVREVWSDPITGAFVFEGIDTTQQFLTLAEDAAGNFRPVAASRLAPEVAP